MAGAAGDLQAPATSLVLLATNRSAPTEQMYLRMTNPRTTGTAFDADVEVTCVLSATGNFSISPAVARFHPAELVPRRGEAPGEGDRSLLGLVVTATGTPGDAGATRTSLTHAREIACTPG